MSVYQLERLLKSTSVQGSKSPLFNATLQALIRLRLDDPQLSRCNSINSDCDYDDIDVPRPTGTDEDMQRRWRARAEAYVLAMREGKPAPFDTRWMLTAIERYRMLR